MYVELLRRLIAAMLPGGPPRECSRHEAIARLLAIGNLLPTGVFPAPVRARELRNYEYLIDSDARLSL